MKWLVLTLFATLAGCSTTGKYVLAAESPSALYVCGFKISDPTEDPKQLKCAPMEVFLGELKKVCEPGVTEKGVQNKL